MINDFDERVLSILEWPLIMNELESRCSTSLGKDRVRASRPLYRDEIILQQLRITELKDLAIQGDSMDFGGIGNITSLVERSRRDSILALEELFRVKNFLRGTARLRSFLKTHSDELPSLKEQFEAIAPCTELEKELADSLTDEGDLSVIRYPQLKRLRTAISDTRSDLEKKLNALINSAALDKVLQEKIHTTVNQRYCILIKAGMKGRVPGTIHDVSASGATLYLEPDSVKNLNDRFIMLGRELESEIEKILSGLSLLTGRHADELMVNQEVAGYLDYLNAATRLSVALKASAPEIVGSPVIDLKQARHPLLQLMQPEGTVANDIDLGADYTCLIISGANTGGKTVMLKTVGCAVLHHPYGASHTGIPRLERSAYSKQYWRISGTTRTFSSHCPPIRGRSP